MPKTYEIYRIADLLRVPIDRRTACLRELEYGLELLQFAFGTNATDVDVGTFRWTDDGETTFTLHDSSGNQVLTLEVTDMHDMQPN